MKNKFIYSPKKSLFEKKLAAGEIGESSIVFIEDTKEIWNRGHYFGMVGSGSGIDPEVLSGIETAIATLQSDKADKSELSDYVLKSELPSLDGYLTKTVADGLYATIAQYNTLSQTVDNVNSDLQTFKNNVALTYATDQDVANLTTKVNGNSVSKSGETLTVSINGSTQSLTNTWRGISDAVDSTSTSVSASSKAVKTAYDKAVAAQSAANTAQTTADNKWTYNATTIAGVKVNNSGNADTVGGFTVGCNVPANAVFTDTKVTSAANHYTPSADSNSQLSVDASSSTAASWNSTSLVTGVNIQRDSKGHVTGVTVDSIKMPANPNTDTNTHYTTRIYAGASGTAANAAASNPYVKITDDNTYRNQIQIKGGGATTVSSDANGVITISSTDTNTHPDLSSYATQTWVNNKGYITGITKTMVTNALGYTPPTTNAATTSAAGLMSATDKSKLNGIASGATAVSSSTVSGWGFTKNTGTVTSITPGTGLTGTSSDSAITTSGTINLKTASTSEIGGIRICADGDLADPTSFALSIGADGKAYTTIQWTDSVSSTTGIASAKAVKTAYDKAVSASTAASNAQTTANSAVTAASNVTSEAKIISASTTITQANFTKRNSYCITKAITVTLDGVSSGSCVFFCGANMVFKCVVQSRVITFNTNGTNTYSSVSAGGTFKGSIGTIVEAMATSGNGANGPLIIKVYKLV